MKSFIILLTLLFVLLAFFSSIFLVYYVNKTVEVEQVTTEPTQPSVSESKPVTDSR